MTYTITKNPAFNSLEIAFNEKPGEAVQEALKSLKFRWHSVKKVWYGYATEEEARAAIDGKPTEPKAKKPVKPFPADLKEAIRAEYVKAWGDDLHMVDYCVGEVSRAIRLSDDCIVTWKKPSIETRFCFGESGYDYDYDDAQRMAAHAATSQDYFKRENLAELDNIISALEGHGEGFYYNASPYLSREGYTSETSPLNLYTVTFSRAYKPKETSPDMIPLKGESLAAVLDAYKAERAAFEKRLDTYLKRYGMSKVKTWTYWRDA